MARRKTFRKRGKKQSSRRRRSLKGKGLGSMMSSFGKDPQKEYRHNLCCDNNKSLVKQNGSVRQVCNADICDDSDAWYLRKIGPF